MQAHVCEAAAMPTRWGMVAAQPAIFLSFSPEHQVWSPSASSSIQSVGWLKMWSRRVSINQHIRRMIIDQLRTVQMCVDP